MIEGGIIFIIIIVGLLFIRACFLDMSDRARENRVHPV
jgi:hypothetical protein